MFGHLQKVRRYPGRWRVRACTRNLNKSSELSVHEMSPARVIPHSSPPGTASEVQTVEMVKGLVVAYELMDPALPRPRSCTIHWCKTAQFFQAFCTSSRLWRRPSREAQLARHARQQACQSLTPLSSCTQCLRIAEKSVADHLVQAATVRPRKHCARCLRAQFQGPLLGRTLRVRKETAGPQTSSGGPSRRWVTSWRLSQATSSREAAEGRALFGPESEVSIVVGSALRAHLPWGSANCL